MRWPRCMSLLPRTTLHSDSEQGILLLWIYGSKHARSSIFAQRIFIKKIQQIEVISTKLWPEFPLYLVTRPYVPLLPTMKTILPNWTQPSGPPWLHLSPWVYPWTLNCPVWMMDSAYFILHFDLHSALVFNYFCYCLSIIVFLTLVYLFQVSIP